MAIVDALDQWTVNFENDTARALDAWRRGVLSERDIAEWRKLCERAQRLLSEMSQAIYAEDAAQ